MVFQRSCDDLRSRSRSAVDQDGDLYPREDIAGIRMFFEPRLSYAPPATND